VQLRTTCPLKLFCGVMARWYAEGEPLATIADATLEPDAVSVNDPLRMMLPLPVSGTEVGEAASELVTISVAVRVPAAVGVKVRVTEQLAPAVSVVTAQGAVTA
jgi:hypothetical protein